VISSLIFTFLAEKKKKAKVKGTKVPTTTVATG